MDDTPPSRNDRSDFFDALKKGLLLGAVILVVAIPSMQWLKKNPQPFAPTSQGQALPQRLADFGSEDRPPMCGTSPIGPYSPATTR